MAEHVLKTDPEPFDAVWNGLKTFEIRRNDRDFQVGDTLRLRETKHSGAQMHFDRPLEYTGREMTKTVSHIQSGYGLSDHWVCLSFAAPAVQAAGAKAKWTDPIESILRAMVHNYGDGPHAWDHLDRAACLRAAEEIERLRAPAPQSTGITDALRKAIKRMDLARDILTDGKPRPECNWGLLDTSDLSAALAAAQEPR